MRDHWPVEMPIRMRTEQPLPGEYVDTRWLYRPGDPWEVCVDFSEDHHPNLWVFSRELLAAGLGGPAGVGDVQIHPAGGRIHVRLCGEEGQGVLSARCGDLHRFLHVTYGWVPAGGEAAYLDVDRTIALITGGGQ